MSSLFALMSWTLRQRRYQALAALMLVVALLCTGAGSFEVHRLQEKRHDNHTLIANAHAEAAPLTTAVVPTTAAAAGPSSYAIRFRTVTATGHYLADADQYVDDQNQDGHQGFYVLTPLRTSTAVLLVVRGFVASTADGTRPASASTAPSGTVTVRGRLQPASGSADKLGRLGHSEITSINPAQQAAALGTPVFAAYLSLNADQPGNADLDPVPAPDLDNPTGGAGELQLLSYVLQWYVFALLALCVPFFFSRNEMREARKRFLGYDPDDVDFDLAAGALEAPDRAVAELGSGGPGAGADGSAVPAVRASGAVASRSDDLDALDAQWRKATALADRYGRSLGTVAPSAADRVRRAAAARRAPIGDDPFERSAAGYDSTNVPHRSADDYHASYNDYLWRLAMADGNLPDVAVPDSPDAAGGSPDEASSSASRVIDARPADGDEPGDAER